VLLLIEDTSESFKRTDSDISFIDCDYEYKCMIAQVANMEQLLKIIQHLGGHRSIYYFSSGKVTSSSPQIVCDCRSRLNLA
jgi:hypothetical protein